MEMKILKKRMNDMYRLGEFKSPKPRICIYV